MCELLLVLQQREGLAHLNADGSPFYFHKAAPVVLFGKGSPPMKKIIMQCTPMVPQSGKRKQSPSAAAPRARKLPMRRVTRKVSSSMAALGSGQSGAPALLGAEESDASPACQVGSHSSADGYHIGFGGLSSMLSIFTG